MAEKGKKSSLLEFALIFLLVYIGSQLLFEKMFPDKYGTPATAGVTVSMLDATVKGGHDATVVIRNDTDKSVALSQNCPNPPVEVYSVRNPDSDSEELNLLTAKDTVLPCEHPSEVAAGESYKLSLAPWKYSLLGTFGTYEVRLPMADESAESPSVRFSIYEAGAITQTFRSFVTKPLLNLIIFIASLLPDHSLGWSIIIVTILVKLLLFLPTQHAMEGQRKLQSIQPKVDELRKKYKSDPQRLNQETLKLWKQEKINPMQSCLPTLLQFPVLIGLFYVVRDGSVLQVSKHLIYDFNQDLSWVFGTNFLGMDLLKPNIYVFPLLLFALQFTQMKLTFEIAKKKKKGTQKVIDVPAGGRKKKEKAPEPQSAQEMQQKMMTYGLPVMIAVFAVQFPAAVALYWAISTLFAIGQQLVVNRKHL